MANKEEGGRNPGSKARPTKSKPVHHGAQELDAVPFRTVPRYCEVLGFCTHPLRNHWAVSLESGQGYSSADAM